MVKISKDFITNPDFDPTKVANASSAAEGLCKWVLAMEIYDRVAKIVAPKKERMQLAEGELNKTLDQLKEKRQELKAVEERLLNLKQQFQEMVEKKEKREEKGEEERGRAPPHPQATISGDGREEGKTRVPGLFLSFSLLL